MLDREELAGMRVMVATEPTPDAAACCVTPAGTAAACCVPLAAASLSAGEAETTASLFKALGDPAPGADDQPAGNQRRAGLRVRSHRDRSGSSQPTVSHHLKKLTSVGLLDREQRGVWAYYSINPAAAARLAMVCDLNGGTR